MREKTSLVFRLSILDPISEHEHIKDHLDKDVRNHLKKLSKNKHTIKLAKIYTQIVEKYKVS